VRSDRLSLPVTSLLGPAAP